MMSPVLDESTREPRTILATGGSQPTAFRQVLGQAVQNFRDLIVVAIHDGIVAGSQAITAWRLHQPCGQLLSNRSR